MARSIELIGTARPDLIGSIRATWSAAEPRAKEPIVEKVRSIALDVYAQATGSAVSHAGVNRSRSSKVTRSEPLEACYFLKAVSILKLVVRKSASLVRMGGARRWLMAEATLWLALAGLALLVLR